MRYIILRTRKFTHPWRRFWLAALTRAGTKRTGQIRRARLLSWVETLLWKGRLVGSFVKRNFREYYLRCEWIQGQRKERRRRNEPFVPGSLPLNGFFDATPSIWRITAVRLSTQDVAGWKTCTNSGLSIFWTLSPRTLSVENGKFETYKSCSKTFS